MSEYRRWFVPGGTHFFTLVALERRPRFACPSSIQNLRKAAAFVQREHPFRFLAAVVLPDHMHFVWTLPPGDSDYPRRIGRFKVHFTRACYMTDCVASGASPTRRRHRDAGIWQRRFWEHVIDGADELQAFLDYIHYNPVKHGYVTCRHAWAASSFARWVARGLYDPSWGCRCEGHGAIPRDIAKLGRLAGEP